MKILAIDLYQPIGHVHLNKKILDLLGQEMEVTFLSSASYVKKVGYKNSISIEDKRFGGSSKYFFVLNQILLIKYILRNYIRTEQYARIIILGYENISLSIAWRYFNIATFAICHNNLTRGRLGNLFFSKISKKITHIFFEEFMKNYVAGIVKNELAVIPHPINSNIYDSINETNIIDDKLIFAPSSSSDYESLMMFAEDVEAQDYYYLLAKGSSETRYENVLFSKYFNNYKELFNKSNYIFIPFKYDYRVSGVFFEAMIIKKIIITNDSSLFMKKMASIYPDCVFIIHNVEEIYKIQINKKKQENQFKEFYNRHADVSLKKELVKLMKK